MTFHKWLIEPGSLRSVNILLMLFCTKWCLWMFLLSPVPNRLTKTHQIYSIVYIIIYIIVYIKYISPTVLISYSKISSLWKYLAKIIMVFRKRYRPAVGDPPIYLLPKTNCPDLCQPSSLGLNLPELTVSGLYLSWTEHTGD